MITEQKGHARTNVLINMLYFTLIKLENPNIDWLDANIQQTFNKRTNTLSFFKTNKYKIVCNFICKRLHIINCMKEYNWL